MKLSTDQQNNNFTTTGARGETPTKAFQMLPRLDKLEAFRRYGLFLFRKHNANALRLVQYSTGSSKSEARLRLRTAKKGCRYHIQQLKAKLCCYLPWRRELQFEAKRPDCGSEGNLVITFNQKTKFVTHAPNEV